MKKILSTLFLLTVILFNALPSKAITYKEASESNKPMAILVYASWVDNLEDIKKAFSNMENKYSQSYNFVYLGIASEDTKLFNQKYHIYPNLPYVLLFKDRGRISRYLQKNCINDEACFTEKLNFFAN